MRTLKDAPGLRRYSPLNLAGFWQLTALPGRFGEAATKPFMKIPEYVFLGHQNPLFKAIAPETCLV